MPVDPFDLIGKQVPAADGGDYGHLIVDYIPAAGDFKVIPICWSTGEPLYPAGTAPLHLDAFKAFYRYRLDKAR
jgi:hypothetical protein